MYSSFSPGLGHTGPTPFLQQVETNKKMNFSDHFSSAWHMFTAPVLERTKIERVSKNSQAEFLPDDPG